MAIVNDGSSSGGGSTSTVCTPNPADNLAILNNVLSRLSDIERFLSMVVGADVYANNLSELATDLGNVINGSITLPQTGYIPGGSVPVPDGFTGQVISGNVTTIWNNGVVSFEVTPSGGITTGGVSRWAQVNILTSGSSITAINILTDTTNLVDVSNPTITINESGLYLFGVWDNIGINTTDAQYSRVQLSDDSLVLPGQTTVAQAGFVTSGSTSGTKNVNAGGSTLVTSIPTDSFALTTTAFASGGTWTHIMTVSILKLS